MRPLAVLFVACTAGSALGAQSYPVLPPTEAVMRALQVAPDVLGAQARLRLESANRQALEAGPYEWNLRVGGQQRRVTPADGQPDRFAEWNAALERPLRLPAKAAADEEIGAAGVAAAQSALGDVRHETARSLLQAWFGWLRASSAAAQWAEQVALLSQQAAAIGRRHQLGDAARVEAVQAEAALAQAEAELVRAQLDEITAAENLQRHFPDIPLVFPENIDAPPPLDGSMTVWVDTILSASHELALARHETRRAQLAAGRRSHDRLPDPVIGVQVSSERGGEEHVVGAYFSIALPGQARRAAVDAALAEAEAASRREAAIVQKNAAEAATRYHAAANAYTAWQASHRAAERLADAAAMAARAYALGEGTLDELLSARRLANQAALDARLRQLDAFEQRYRLLLDAHRLLDEDAGPHSATQDRSSTPARDAL